LFAWGWEGRVWKKGSEWKEIKYIGRKGFEGLIFLQNIKGITFPTL